MMDAATVVGSGPKTAVCSDRILARVEGFWER